MSQFEVVRLRGSPALLVDCQTDFLDHLPTRFVVPLLPVEEAPEAAAGFNPILQLDGRDYHFAPQYAASVRVSDLEPADTKLDRDYDKITAAIDFLIGGF